MVKGGAGEAAAVGAEAHADWPSRNQDLRSFGGRFSRSSSLFFSGRLKRDMRWIMAM
jgi:hypothetical protein